VNPSQDQSFVPCNGYLPQLDGLRFIAASLVFLHHCAPLPALSWLKEFGWVGVDLFLLLSSYLLASIVRLELLNTGKMSVGNFFVRRALRIWPLFIGFVLAMAVSALYQTGFSIELLGQVLTHFLFINNLIVAVNGYGGVLPYCAHLWTISLEEQFYLIVPFVVPAFITLSNSKERTALSFVIGAILMQIAIRFACVSVGMRHPFIWTLWFRFDSIILGTALGAGTFDSVISRIPTVKMQLSALVLLALVLLFPSMSDGGWEQVYAYTIVDFGFLFLLASLIRKTWLTQVLSLRPLPYLGRISYGIYVFHMVVIGSFGIDGTKPIPAVERVPMILLSFIATIVLAGLSYEFFEKPFLKLKKHFRSSGLAAG
jgi:peptidoglycan/LPS O-acetylase OafA/YrhL